MGICIQAKNSSLSFDCSYGGFFNLRKNLALAYDKEFGEHYATLMKNRYDKDYIVWEEKMNQILSDERFDDSDILDFFFASDCEGKISYKTCGKLYEMIKNIDFGNKIFTYALDGKNYEQFKTFLKECYSHRRNMVWY